MTKRKGLEYYEAKYNHGFWNYWKQCSLIGELAENGANAVDAFVEFIFPLGRFLFICAVIIGKPLAWPILRIIEYRSCRKELSDIIKAMGKSNG